MYYTTWAVQLASKRVLSGSDCLKINGGWGFAPNPTGGAYSTPPEPLATFKGSYIKGRGGEGGGADYNQSTASVLDRQGMCLILTCDYLNQTTQYSVSRITEDNVTSALQDTKLQRKSLKERKGMAYNKGRFGFRIAPDNTSLVCIDRSNVKTL